MNASEPKIMKWLEAHAPGFAMLPGKDRGAIIEFAFLWSLFEAQILDGRASVGGIRTRVEEWRGAGTLAPDLYAAELVYFRGRYFANGEFTYHFPHLNLRKTDAPDLVAAVLSGANADECDGVMTILVIVWRLRNNLFHGAKWAYHLQDQFENFSHANAVLQRVLERHGHMAG